MAKKVTVINADRNRANLQEQPKLKVCGYARVSTGSKVQAESYAVQIAYFTEKIENNPLWELVGMYADEAATGTKVKGREEFQAMVRACEGGDIDMILTKSVSRFARNTMDALITIRKLKEKNVAVVFEKGQVIVNHNKFMGYTKNEKGELVIVPEEAEIVRTVFRLYLKGYSAAKISEHLQEKGIRTTTGKEK